MTFPFVKGHGTRNDFVVLPDLDGSVHGDLAPALVVALCDRRGGIGADGVLRVLRGDEGGWLMDYRNADGSTSEMCGNGIRVFARYLEEAGLVDPSEPLEVETRDGVKYVSFCADGEISVEMGTPKLGRSTTVVVGGRSFDAIAVDIGNPHAVAIVGSLTEIGDLLVPPEFPAGEFPSGANVELVELAGDHTVMMRVFERGVGETASCGTGACAAAAAVVGQRGERPPVEYQVEVPGGRLAVTMDVAGVVHLKGPAVLVAEGTWTASPQSLGSPPPSRQFALRAERASGRPD